MSYQQSTNFFESLNHAKIQWIVAFCFAIWLNDKILSGFHY